MVNSASNSLGSGPLTGVPVLRLGRVRWDEEELGGRRAELEREMLSWADFWRACSSAMRESMASRRRFLGLGPAGTQGTKISYLKHRHGLKRNNQINKRKNTSNSVDHKDQKDKQLATDRREGEHWLAKSQGGTAMWSAVSGLSGPPSGT